MSKSTRQQFADTMVDIGKVDEDLVVMVGDIGHGMFKPFAQAYPSRYYNIGILEPTMVSMGAGLAATGLVPVVHTIAPFLIERAFEQIKLDFCYHKLPGNIVTVGSAFDYSNLGCTHHCYGDFAMLKTLQGAQICFPSSPVEFDQLFKQSYRNNQLTVYRIAGTSHKLNLDPRDIVFGKALRVREGHDLTIIATGPHLRTALEASEVIASMGYRAEIIYVHTIRPLDIDSIRASVEKTRKVIVIEEHMRTGGLGDDVLRATYNIQDIKFHSISIPDVFVTSYGTYEQLSESCGLTSAAVIQAFKQWLE